MARYRTGQVGSKMFEGSKPRIGGAGKGRVGRRALGAVAVAAIMMIGVTVGLTVVALLPETSATGGSDLHLNVVSLVLTPTKGADATSVTLTGSGFPATTTVSLTFVESPFTAFNLNGQPYPYNTARTVTTNATGAFTYSYGLPDINTGTFEFIAAGGGASASANFKVDSSGVTFSLSKTSVAPGACVTIKGTGFYPMDVENLYVGPWSNKAGFKTLKLFDDNFTGGFSHRFCTKTGMTDWPAGTYAIVVVGDTYGTGAKVLTVT